MWETQKTRKTSMHKLDTADAEKKVKARRSCAVRPAVALALLACLHCISPVLAQVPANPPEPEKPVLQWVFAIAITIVCVAVAFKNPRRSHLG